MPPGARKASTREIIRFLEDSLQLGYPAPMSTDASLGFSVMAYQSWDIVHGRCEAYLSTLVRIEGLPPKGRDGKTDNLFHRAKAGYFP